jgi:hypothetical protein
LKNKRDVRGNTIGDKLDEHFSLFTNAAVVDDLQGSRIGTPQSHATATTTIPTPATDEGGTTSNA